METKNGQTWVFWPKQQDVFNIIRHKLAADGKDKNDIYKSGSFSASQLQNIVSNFFPSGRSVGRCFSLLFLKSPSLSLLHYWSLVLYIHTHADIQTNNLHSINIFHQNSLASSHFSTMEAYSSSSSSSMSQSSLPYYTSSLHAVRKAPMKPWKKPVAPLPPTPPRVYKVDPVNFRDLVQRLTAAPEFQLASDQRSPNRLRTMAPPPVDIETEAPAVLMNFPQAAILHRPKPAKAAGSSLSGVYREFSEALDQNKTKLLPPPPPPQPQNVVKGSSETTSSLLGLNFLSPSNNVNSHGWCSFPLLSPGTLSSLEQSTVL